MSFNLFLTEIEKDYFVWKDKYAVKISLNFHFLKGMLLQRTAYGSLLFFSPFQRCWETSNITYPLHIDQL